MPSSSGFWASKGKSNMPPREIDVLRKKLEEIDFDNASIRSFKGLPTMDYGFFPGGNGLFDGIGGDISRISTLVLGSNFGCDNSFVDQDGQLRTRDERTSSPTWSSKGGLKNTFRGVAMITRARTAIIDLRECFYTNAWPFLHKGGSNDDPPIEGWLQDDGLMSKCLSFFVNETLPVIKPKVIVALGKGPAVFLSRIWPEKLKQWSLNEKTKWKDLTFAKLDRLFFEQVKYAEMNPYCVVLTHRSRAHINARFRKQPYSDLDGEKRLLDHVADKAGLNWKGRG
jgi:hypothetical protein